MAKVLIIDDECIYGEQLIELLSADSHEVVTAFNASVGISIAAKINPDILIIDWMLSGDCDGLEVARILKERAPTLQVIAITGHEAQSLQSAAKCPLFAVLEKPFRIRQLREAVQSALAARPAPISINSL